VKFISYRKSVKSHSQMKDLNKKVSNESLLSLFPVSHTTQFVLYSWLTIIFSVTFLVMMFIHLSAINNENTFLSFLLIHISIIMIEEDEYPPLPRPVLFCIAIPEEGL
jgi:uncharacterized membrane protein